MGVLTKDPYFVITQNEGVVRCTVLIPKETAADRGARAAERVSQLLCELLDEPLETCRAVLLDVRSAPQEFGPITREHLATFFAEAEAHDKRVAVLVAAPKQRQQFKELMREFCPNCGRVANLEGLAGHWTGGS